MGFPALALSILTNANELSNLLESDKFGIISAKSHGAIGDGVNDDSPRMQEAMDVIKVNDGGIFYLPLGRYLMKSRVKVPSNTMIIAMPGTICMGDVNLFTNFDDGEGTDDTDDNTHNILFYGITFQSLTNVFLEFVHLLKFSHVTNFFVISCSFLGWLGDAITISGSAGVYGAIRHNLNLHFSNCYFDGINNDNRNAISILDVDGCIIENNIFKNCTRSNMPGAIDLEPNPLPVESKIKNIKILNNKFYNIGGTNGAISMYFPVKQETMIDAVNNILIEGNLIDNCGKAIYYVQTTDGLLDSTPRADLKIINNRISNISQLALHMYNIRGVEIKGNTISKCQHDLRLGYISEEAVFDCDIEGNKFIEMGITGGVGLAVHNTKRLNIRKNLFFDCGLGNAGSGGIDFTTADNPSSYVTIEDNDFVTPTGKSLFAIHKEAEHTFTESTNVCFGNRFNGLPNEFEYTNATMQTAWIAPSLENSWVNFGGSYGVAGYYKDDFGVIHLKGIIKSGTAVSGTVLFTLPIGYRPATKKYFSTVSNDLFGAIKIDDGNGQVQILAGSNVYFSLDGITFRV